MTLQAFVDNDNIVQLKGLKDHIGALINDAVVNLESVLDANGDAVAGVMFPVAIPNRDTTGLYYETLDAALEIVSGQTYTAIVTVVGGGLEARFEIPFIANTRTIR